MKSNLTDTHKINLFESYVLHDTLSMSKGLEQSQLPHHHLRHQCAKFYLPSSYLAFTVFPEDIRIDESRHQWTNNQIWKPASDSFSPIAVFPYINALAVANFRSDHISSFPVFPSHPGIEEEHTQPSTSCSTSHGTKHEKLKSAKR